MRTVILFLVLLLVSFKSMAQTCPEQFTLRETTCPEGTINCTTKGSTLTWAELDADILNSVGLCNTVGQFTWPAVGTAGVLLTSVSGSVSIIQSPIVIPPFTSVGDDTATFQAVIDTAAAFSGKATVIAPAGSYNICNLKMKSRVDFIGAAGRGTKFTATSGCNGGMIELDTTSVERFRLSNLWLEGNKASATVSCADFDSDGGTFTGADPNINISDVFCTNPALDGFRLKSRGMQLHNLEVRNPTQDCFSFLAGSTVSATDIVGVNLHANACQRDGLHMEAGNNVLASVKVGEAQRYGILITANVGAISLSSVNIDNTGYPSFGSGTPVRIEGVDNIVESLTITRGLGDAIVIPSGGNRNRVSAQIAPVVGGGTITYGILVSSGAVDNDIRLNARLAGSVPMTGPVNPASDLVNNRVEVNNVLHGPTKSANTVLSGPVSGGSAAPTFRSLVAADIPAHSTSHISGGSDEVATTVPGANAIPKAGAGSTLAAGWLPTASTSTQGAVILSSDAETTAGEAVQGNDSRLSGLSSGPWTATLTGVANVAATTAFSGQWIRVGNTVIAGARIDVDPTSGNTPTTVGISLPVASNFTGAANLSGAGSSDLALSVGHAAGSLYADATNDRAELAFTSEAGAANRTWRILFIYLVQ